MPRKNLDEGAWLQAQLDRGRLELEDRTYYSGRQLIYGAGCQITGKHPSLSVIAAHPSFTAPPGNGFLVNREQVFEGSQITRGVRFRDFSIRGSDALRESAVGIGLIGVADSLFANIAISGFKWLVTPANSTRLTWERLEGYDYACAVRPEDAGNINCEGGTAFLGHSAYPNTHFDLIDCYFHDGAWTAIDTSIDGGAHHWRILRPLIHRVMEAGIFGRLTDSCVIGAEIHDVRPRAVAAQGFEGGMVRSEWIGGTIANTGGSSILLLDPREKSIVRNVGVYDPCRHFKGDAIAVRGANVDGLTIEHCYGSNHAGGDSAPIGFYTERANNVTVRGRHFWQWSTGNIVREVPGARGENFVIED